MSERTDVERVLEELMARLATAKAELGGLADSQKEMDNHYFRLLGKIQGMNLALSYAREALRSEHADY